MDMAEKSAYNEIKRKVKSSKRGTLFFFQTYLPIQLHLTL